MEPWNVQLSWQQDNGYERIRRAHALAQYVSHGEPADANEFTQALQSTWPDEWDFAKRHMAFHSIHERLRTLDQILKGFGREVVEIQSNIGAMVSTSRIFGWDSHEFRESEDQCALVIRNLTSLYGTFIDVARQLMREIPLKEEARKRAVARLGSGLVLSHSQKMTAAASAMADRKTFGHLS